MTKTHAALVTAGIVAAVALTLPAEQSQPPPPALVECEEKTTCLPGPSLVCDVLESSRRKGDRYRRAEVPSTSCVTYRVCLDGGVEQVASKTEGNSPRKGIHPVPGSCAPASAVLADRMDDGGVLFVQEACACSTGKDCRYVFDSGVVDAPRGRTLGPGYPPFEAWTGRGCHPKACTEMFGEPSWPPECPR